MFCPECGEKLKLEPDEKMALLLKNIDYYFAKCKNNHMWYAEIDYMDDGRIVLKQVRRDD